MTDRCEVEHSVLATINEDVMLCYVTHEEQTFGLNAVGHLNSACCNISDSDDYK